MVTRADQVQAVKERSVREAARAAKRASRPRGFARLIHEITCYLSIADIARDGTPGKLGIDRTPAPPSDPFLR